VSEPKQEPIVATPELARLILARSLAVIDFVTADELRLREYTMDEYNRYCDWANANDIPADISVQELAKTAMEQLAFVQKAIQGLLRDGSVPPKPPEIGAYL
jgi:hypothetical protein